MLIIEITNDGKHPNHPDWGSYDYIVKVNRREIAHGHIESHDRSKHFSFLLNQIADDAKWRAFVDTVGEAEALRYKAASSVSGEG